MSEKTTATAATQEERGIRKELAGIVVSDKMDKTIVVRVERTYRHPLYLKVLRSSKKVYVHDEKEEANPGDLVKIIETRPLSRLKRWRLIEVLEKGKEEIPVKERAEKEKEVKAKP